MAEPAANASRENETRVMALAGVAARVVNAGLVFLTQILFARVMGVAEFGVYATANTLMLLVAGFATLGLTVLPQRFWPQYAAAGDLARLRGLARFACVAPFAYGTLFALAGAGAAWMMQDVISTPVALVTCIAMIVVPAQASLDVVEGIALARAWKSLAYGVAFVFRPLTAPLIFTAAWMSGAGADGKAAMIGLAGATWLSALLLIVMVRMKLRPELGQGPVVVETRLWFRCALPVMLVDGVFMLMTSADILLLSVLRGDSEVGLYAAAARLTALAAFVHQGLTWASAHHFAALHQSGDRQGLAAYAARTVRWTFLPSLAMAAVLALGAPLLLHLFGRGFDGGGTITAVLLLGLLARAAVGPAEQLLVMTDNQIATAYAYAWAFVVNAGLGLVLVPVWGGLGAAIATALAYGAASLILAREVRLRLGFSVHLLSRPAGKRRQAAHA